MFASIFFLFQAKNFNQQTIFVLFKHSNQHHHFQVKQSTSSFFKQSNQHHHFSSKAINIIIFQAKQSTSSFFKQSNQHHHFSSKATSSLFKQSKQRHHFSSNIIIFGQYHYNYCWHLLLQALISSGQEA